jgi:Undecaprenyl-phosphate glucose phosphotransferase
MMIGEPDARLRQSIGISGAYLRPLVIRDRRAPLNLRNSRQIAALATPPAAGVTWSPLRLFVLLIGSECLAIIACSVLLAAIGPAGQETGLYAEAAIAGLGVAVLFALIRPMIRFSTASPKGTAIISISLPGTLAALALAQLGALGGYAYLAHYFGTTIPPVSFHNWLRAWALSTSIVGLLDFGAGRLLAKWVREGRLAKRIVVYGGGDHASRFLSEVASRRPGEMLVCGYFDDRSVSSRATIFGVRWLGDSHRLADYVREEKVDEIVIALPWSADQRILEILRRLRHLPVPIRLAPEMIAFSAAGVRVAAEDAATLTMRDRPVSEWNLLVKSLFDRIAALGLLLLLLPTLGMVACLIKLESPGPVFFRQKRLGFNNRPFEVLKFRSMTHGDSQKTELQQAQRSDRRVTRIGQFLRRSSIDELPQLFNVLRGEMSLVGPRPHPIWTRADQLWPDEGDRPLDAIFSEYASRHRMKPGITGWAQVSGYRGETETPEKMAKRVEHDIYYIDNCSLAFDLRILAKTVLAAIADKNAY